MSSELTVIAPKSIEEAKGLAKDLSAAHTLPEALKQKPADILAIVLTGAELGLAPMQAIRGIQIIKGKPTLAADTMGALVKRRTDICEYLILKESTAERAVYEAKRKGDPAPTTMSFTMQDAQRARIKSDMYEKYPAQMLRARCLSAICRAVFPDLCLGLYDPEELGGESPAAPPERDVTPAPQSIPRTATAAKAELARVVGTLNAHTPTDAEVVSEAKPAPKMPIVDETKGPDPATIYRRCCKLGEAAGMNWQAVGAQLKELTGKPNWQTLTEDDLETFARWLDDEPSLADKALDAVLGAPA